MRVVGCLLEYQDNFVILLRKPHKPQGNTWGLPSGKIENAEIDEDAAIRELEEETGYKAKPYQFERDGTMDNHYSLFRVRLESPHSIRLEEGAHAAYKWVTAEQCYQMPDLIPTTGHH
jgi:8-oxo-dGTP pyrophosphatase MutT (NUDIX family)